MKLDGEGTVPNRVNAVEARTVRTAPVAAGRKSQDAPASGGNPPAAGVDVHITGTARGLAVIEQQLHELPAIDESRVAAVRARLDEGSYRIDAQRIADHLLVLEQDLTPRHPVDHAT